jgi:hypothetical protein
VTCRRLHRRYRWLVLLGLAALRSSGGTATEALPRPRYRYRGRGMRVEVTSSRHEGYALVALGTSRVDVRDYRRLRFRVRGRSGGEKDAVYLNSGKKRASVRLEEHVEVGETWQAAEIPLARFREQGVELDRVLQVVIAFENREIAKEVLWFDDFVFE